MNCRNEKTQKTPREREIAPRISVILPFYNAAQYLSHAIQSIQRQTMRELEILAVDDGSTDRSAEIVRDLARQDPRIRLLSHGENKGLFQARITGVLAARGTHIAFVDADDAVSIDWFRLLYKTATALASDITVGQFVCAYGKDRLEYFPLDPLRQPLSLDGEEVLRAFLGQEGSCYSWHVVWNKLYAKELWTAALPSLQAFSEQHPHMVMCEDIAFSCALWSRAKRVRSVTEGGYYFYNRANTGQSTAVRRDRRRILQNLEQAAAAFSFLLEEIRSQNAPADCFSHALAWRQYYGEMYFKMLSECRGHHPRRDGAEVCRMLSLADGTDVSTLRSVHSFFYASARCEKAIHRMESIKDMICDEEISVVSFDLFDTLLLRPFLTPEDLFLLLDDLFNELCDTHAFVRFSTLRVLAERACREHILSHGSVGFEEITLDEIYGQIERDYRIPKEILSRLQEREKELELHFSRPRQSGRALLELARELGKRVILCSDIYLPKNLILAILKKHGYPTDGLYLSSEIRLSKAGGGMFPYVQRALGVSANRILHIGDNWESDVLAPARAGWRSAHFPKTSDLLRNWNPGSYTGEGYASLTARNGKERDGKNAESQFLGYRCAMALAANRLYDDPFTLFAEPSDFGGDPYRIGYFALGQYLYAITEWIAKKAKASGGERIHFVARDGFLPMQAYRILRAQDPSLPCEHYLFLSRKALALADIATSADLLSLWDKWNTLCFSPKRLDALFAPYRRENAKDLAALLPDGVYQKRFRRREDADRALLLLLPSIDFERIALHRRDLKAYFSSLIRPQDLLFDIGYSGRAEAALTSLLDFPVSSLYLHTNGQILFDRQRRYGFQSHCFYDYKPAITGVIREHVFMKLSPSTIGYERIGDTLQPQWGEYDPDPRTVLVTEALQNAALDFVRDMRETFAGFTEQLPYRRADLTAAFESFLHAPKEIDRALFGSLFFEDDLGESRSFSALDFWDRERREFGLCDRRQGGSSSLPDVLLPFPRWKKAVCYFLLDRSRFWESWRRLWKQKFSH
ncbi:MAG: glycosyltransferase [Clostridia bacterium]|nr:glycosyltransferase [Clostridia bacterium]